MRIHIPQLGKARMMSTKEVLEHHLKCFAAGDLEGIVADYAPNAVLFSPLGFAGAGGVTKGRGPIRDFFDAVFAEFAKPSTSFEMRRQAVEGDYAYILWAAETADNIYEVGSDTFVVQAGKIVAQSFAGKIMPNR